MTAEVLELGSYFELVSSPEGRDGKVAALRHGFVHLRGNSATPPRRRRALSAEVRSCFEAEELAFARYVATFHFCRTSEIEGAAAFPASGGKTPTGARRALVEFAMPAVATGDSSCGGDDAEASTKDTEEPFSSQPTPTAVGATPPQSAASATDVVETCKEEPSSCAMPVVAATTCAPSTVASSPTADLPAQSCSAPRKPELTLPVPVRMRKDAPTFVPGAFGPPQSAAAQPPVRRGPLSTAPTMRTPTMICGVSPSSQMPPNSPSGSFEAGSRVPPPPPASPPRVVAPAAPPGAFHSPPPRGTGGPSCMSPLPQAFYSPPGPAPSHKNIERVPMPPPMAAPKLTHALLRDHPKCRQAASVKDDSEYASASSSTTAPSSVEEASDPPEEARRVKTEQVQRRGSTSQRLSGGQGHFSQGRAGPRERAGTTTAATQIGADDDTKQDVVSMRKKGSACGGSPSNTRNMIWRPKRRASWADA